MASPNYNISGNFSNYTKRGYSSVEINYLQISYAVFGSLSTIWVTLANVVLIAGILSSASLRRNRRNIFIVSIAFSDLLVGLFLCPVLANLGVRRRWVSHCFLQALLRILFRYSDIFIPAWGLIFIGGDYLRRQLRFELPTIPFCKRTWIDLFLPLLPWTFFIVVVFPIIFTGLHDYVNKYSYFVCHLPLTSQTETALNVVCYFIPAFALLVLIVLFIVFHTCKRPSVDIRSQGLLDEGDILEHPICFIVPMVVTVALALPDQAMYTAHYNNGLKGQSYLSRIVFYTFVSYLDTMRAGILPLTWLLLKDIRDSVKEILRWRPWHVKSSATPANVSVSYKNMNA